jgi:hypothetical protein
MKDLNKEHNFKFIQINAGYFRFRWDIPIV